MNFNKCSRCGCFFLNDSSVCPNCQPIDQMEMNRLQDYINENSSLALNTNLETVASSTGITIKNLNRFLGEKQFADFASSLQNQVNNKL